MIRLAALFAIFVFAGWSFANDNAFHSAISSRSNSINTIAKARENELEDWMLVGRAKLRVLFWEIYESELYTPSGKWLDQAPFRLVLTYLREVSTEQLVKETAKVWRAQDLYNSRSEKWLNYLLDIWPDVSPGDTLTFQVNPDNDSVFFFNGQQIGTVADTEFGRRFGGIWLAENSPKPILRNQLLGHE